MERRKRCLLFALGALRQSFKKFAFRPEGPGAVSVKNDRIAEVTTSEERLGGSGQGCSGNIGGGRSGCLDFKMLNVSSVSSATPWELSAFMALEYCPKRVNFSALLAFELD